jgi:hypothetical protein
MVIAHWRGTVGLIFFQLEVWNHLAAPWGAFHCIESVRAKWLHQGGKACNLLKPSLTTAKHATATVTFPPTFLPSLYSFLTLLTVLRVLLTFRVSYVSGVLANIMTESSPLLLEMWQKLRTQISKIQRDCIMVCIRLVANHYTKWFWKT